MCGTKIIGFLLKIAFPLLIIGVVIYFVYIEG